MKRNLKLLVLLSAFMGSGILGGTSLAADMVVENGDTMHYFSMNSQPDLKNYNNEGAGPEGSIAIGPNVTVGPNATGAVLLGHDTEILHPKVGEDTYNNNANHSIVVGNHLTVEGISNAVFGTKYNNYDTKETKVFGDNNTVIGIGNLVGWKATKNSDDQTKWDYVKSDSGSDQAVVVGVTNTGEGGSVLLGSSNEARDLGIAIGAGNTVKGYQAMVFGRDSQAVKDQDLAVGFETEASGEESTAVGYQAKATGRNAAGFGAHAEASTEGAIGFGSYAVATGDFASALGYASNATANYGVALGAWSSADVGKGVSGYLAAEKTDDQHDSVWTSTLGAVSVGNANQHYTRQITNVAAGLEDTDAVNVAQLKAVNKKIDAFSDTNTKITGGTIAYEANGTGTMTLNDSDNNQVTISGLKNTYTQSGEYKKEEKSLVFSQNDDTKYTVDMSGLVNEMNTAATEGDTHVKAETVQVTNNTVSLTLVNGKDEEQGKVVINDIASKTELDQKANKDASNIEANKWSEKLGTGEVKEGNTSLVTGGVVFDAVDQKANKDASNIEVNKWSEKLGIGEVKAGDTNLVSGDTVYNAIQSSVSAAATIVESADDYIQVTPPEKGKHNYKVGLTVNGQVKKDDTGLVTGGVVFDAVDQKANKDASNIEGENKIKWQEKLGDGQVEKGNKGLVNGGTLFDEVRVEKDGNYIKADNSAAKNMMALDAQVGTNATNIATNVTNIANNTTNITKNAKDIATNAAHINSLGTKVNDVGAGAATLAGLHPLDYDPDYKWDFTAAYGHYDDSDALALGTFYRPNSQYMFSVGAIVGNSDDMYNVGFSAKIGRGSEGHVEMSRTALVKEVRNLKADNEDLRADNEDLRNENANLREQNERQDREIMAIKAALARLEGK